MHIRRVTYLLIVLVIVTTAFAYRARGNRQSRIPQKPTGTSSTQKEQEEYLKKAKEARSRFPIVDYDEAEPTDPVKKARRKEKQKRYDGNRLVARHPHPLDAEVSSIYEGPALPALPTSKSNVILIGTVTTGEAHLSDDKKNIYSEFSVQFDDVLKAEVSLPPDKIVTVDREGGMVNYPNGQKILYRTSRENMPTIGKRYVFFLQYVDQDLRILTAYGLDEGKVIALDDSDQFKRFTGQDAASFLNNLRADLARPQE